MNISSRRLYNAHFLFLTQFYFFNNVVCTLSENACKYFYQATITVGVEWGFLGIGVRMGVFVRSVSINPWPFYLFYMYSIGLCTCITKSPEQILMIK